LKDRPLGKNRLMLYSDRCSAAATHLPVSMAVGLDKLRIRCIMLVYTLYEVRYDKNTNIFDRTSTE